MDDFDDDDDFVVKPGSSVPVVAKPPPSKPVFSAKLRLSNSKKHKTKVPSFESSMNNSYKAVKNTRDIELVPDEPEQPAEVPKPVEASSYSPSLQVITFDLYTPLSVVKLP